MIFSRFRTLGILGCLALLLIPVIAPADEITVFAGSASQPPLEELAATWQQQTGNRVILHFGGSGTMLNQIRLTGAGDIYIPGSPDFLSKAQRFQLLDADAKILAYLLPAIIVPKGNPAKISGLNDLARPGLRVGMADPEGVCVGLYGVELLAFNHLLEKVRPNLVGMVESCAKAAAMIPLGQVDAVLGWREFGNWNPAASEVILLQPAQIPRIAYIPAAVIRTSTRKRAAGDFLRFLTGPEGAAVFARWGYITDEAEIRRLAPRAKLGGEYLLPGSWQ